MNLFCRNCCFFALVALSIRSNNLIIIFLSPVVAPHQAPFLAWRYTVYRCIYYLGIRQDPFQGRHPRSIANPLLGGCEPYARDVWQCSLLESTTPIDPSSLNALVDDELLAGGARLSGKKTYLTTPISYWYFLPGRSSGISSGVMGAVNGEILTIIFCVGTAVGVFPSRRAWTTPKPGQWILHGFWPLQSIKTPRAWKYA